MIDWATLSPYVPALIVVLALAVAALSVAAVLVARRSTEPVDDGLGAAEGLEVVYLGPCTGSTSEAIEKALRQGRREMRRSGLVAAPWFLMVGESGAGKSTLLAESGLPHPFGGQDSGAPLDLWLFSETAVLDPKGELVLRRDGHSNDEKGWLCLLRQIKEQRPRRPLDGIILTIPAERLFVGQGAAKDQAALQADASLRANALFERLAELQQILGMRLSVDVVITQADHIPGWPVWIHTLPVETQRQIFGWSSPYAPEAPYQASWTGEAFATFNDRLAESQATTFGSGSKPSDPTAFLDFPQNLAALEPATRIYLNHLFSQSAFVESFMMRGLYVTGGAFDHGAATAISDVVGLCPPSPKPTPNRRQPRQPDRILFAHDLLKAKVFPENALGLFTEQASASAKAEKRLAQIAALLVPILILGGMLFDHGRVAKDSAALALPISHIAADLSSSAEADRLVEQAGDLVDDAKDVDHYILRGLFLPPSWWSPQHAKVRNSFKSGYDDIVFPALRGQLGRWQRELAAPWPPPTSSPDLLYPVETPEFEQLQAFSKQLTRFDSDVWLYDCLVAHCTSGSGALSAFDRLSGDLLDSRLQPPSAAARRFYAHTLSRIDAESFGVDAAGRLGIDNQAQRLSNRFDERLFFTNPLLQELRDLNAEIERLELDTDASAADYRLLLEQIQQTNEDLKQPEVAWMGENELQPGPVVLSTYDALAASPYVGPETVEDLEAQAQDDFATMRREMATLSNPSTGTVLALDKNGQALLQLSDAVDELEEAIQTFVDEEFMNEEPKEDLQVPTQNERLFWNQNGLKKTTDLVTSYQSFADGGVSPFPEDLQGTTEEVALATLAEHMLDELAAAQSFRPAPSRISSQTLERGLAMQVRNYSGNNAALAQILDDFQALQLYDAYDQLTDVLTVQQTHLLEDLDALLDLEPLFQPVDTTFSWWQGVQPPAPPAFGLETPASCPPPADGWCSPAVQVAATASSSNPSAPKSAPAASGPCVPNANNTAEVQSWVAEQTANATQLVSAYAEPILGSPTVIHLLPSKRLDRLTERWQSITTDVDQEKKKQPGNPIQSLSLFINETMMEISLGNCFDVLPGTGGSGDYFRDRQNELVRGLGARCHELAAEDGLADFRRYAQIFNERLAGLYPFTVADPATPINTEATPVALRDFYSVFDQSACLMPRVRAGDPAFDGHEEEVRVFVTQMGEVREFLSPFLDNAKKYPLPTYGYRVEFRVNRNREIGADQIIDWQLQVGEETQAMGLRTQPPPPPPPTNPTTTSGAAPTSSATTALGGEWIFGEESILSLRWAQESPTKPTTPPTSDRARLSGRTVTWDYENLWSLLALVRDYPSTADDFPGTLDPRPETLKLTVGTEQPSDRDSTPTKTEAVVFVRITFTTPDFSSELKVPGFPVAAPKLTEPAFTSSASDLEVTFTNETRGRYDSLLWGFGDGDESRETNPTHNYKNVGEFDVTLEATTDGVTESTSQSIVVGEGEPPAASFSTSENGLEITFTDTSTQSPTSQTWTFGDGTSSSEAKPTHLYGRAGTYEVTLKVTNAAGEDVAKEEIQVHDVPADEKPKARFTALPEGGNFVRFVDNSKGEIISWAWDFGDGQQSTEQNPGHLYEERGDHQVRLVVKGPGGESETIGTVTVR